MTTVTIELPPEMENRLRTAAARSGKTIEAYLLELASRVVEECPGDQRTTISTASFETSKDWIAAWRSWVHSRPVRSILADDSRENIYEGQGE